jgi:hypothetical protein
MSKHEALHGRAHAVGWEAARDSAFITNRQLVYGVSGREERRMRMSSTLLTLCRGSPGKPRRPAACPGLSHLDAGAGWPRGPSCSPQRSRCRHAESLLPQCCGNPGSAAGAPASSWGTLPQPPLLGFGCRCRPGCQRLTAALQCFSTPSY